MHYIDLEKHHYALTKIGNFCHEENRHSMITFEDCQRASEIWLYAGRVYNTTRPFCPTGCFYNYRDTWTGSKNLYWNEPWVRRSGNENDNTDCFMVKNLTTYGEVCYGYGKYSNNLFNKYDKYTYRPISFSMYIHVTLYFLEFTYFASEANKLCKDTNDVPVLDMQTCAETIGYIDNVDSEFISSHEEFTVTSPSYPPGCYVRGPAHVFFNNHLDGKKAPNSRQVCENRGKTNMFGFELEGYLAS